MFYVISIETSLNVSKRKDVELHSPVVVIVARLNVLHVPICMSCI